MPTLRRLCPACKVTPITAGRRCATCERAYNQQRGTTTARGLGYAYQQKRPRILARDHGICWLCGEPGADTLDHVVSRARGGGDDDANLRAAHLRCNSAKK